MKKYIGTKQVQAKPMDRYDYNEYRGWKLPEDEDPSDEGYLVEYLDGGEPNHSNHDGYISWSPKEQFDNAYKENGTAKQRVEIELTELQAKSESLIAYMGTLPNMDLMLVKQATVMSNYGDVLIERLANWVD